MKAGLVVVEVGRDPAENLERVCAATREAAAAGCRLVLFGEAVLTGLVNRDDPAHDLGQPIRGPATTELGRVAFLLCGDLFDDEVVQTAKALRPDLLLFPFWRCFDDGSTDDLRWQLDKAEDYAERIAETLMVNALAAPAMLGGAFGGAFHLAATGRTLARLPLGGVGRLEVEPGRPPPGDHP